MNTKDVPYFTQRAINERAMAKQSDDAFRREMHERFAAFYESELETWHAEAKRLNPTINPTGYIGKSLLGSGASHSRG